MGSKYSAPLVNASRCTFNTQDPIGQSGAWRRG